MLAFAEINVGNCISHGEVVSDLFSELSTYQLPQGVEKKVVFAEEQL